MWSNPWLPVFLILCVAIVIVACALAVYYLVLFRREEKDNHARASIIIAATNEIFLLIEREVKRLVGPAAEVFFGRYFDYSNDKMVICISVASDGPTKVISIEVNTRLEIFMDDRKIALSTIFDEVIIDVAKQINAIQPR